MAFATLYVLHEPSSYLSFEMPQELLLIFAGPDDPYISFHIQGVGGWTKGLYSLCEKKLTATAITDFDTHTDKVDLELGDDDKNRKSLVEGLQVNVDGPFGAPAQDHSSFSCLLLVVSKHISGLTVMRGDLSFKFLQTFMLSASRELPGYQLARMESGSYVKDERVSSRTSQ